jgi:MoaA/NifB/PqqE/SkfB family radical SAM enzyme
MSPNQFQKIADKLKAYGAYIGFISGGEPTLVPNLEEILRIAKDTFSLSTTLVTGLINKTEIIQRIGRLALDLDIHIQTSLDGLGPLGDELRGTPNFSKTVLKHMEWLSSQHNHSHSLLYANIVINNLNVHQIPDLIQQVHNVGWRSTIGLYHSLTATTRSDKDLILQPGKAVDDLIASLIGDQRILNLPSFIKGIPGFIAGTRAASCAFVKAPVLATRTTIMEDGSVHLCHGGSIGNLFSQELGEIFQGSPYKQRLKHYRHCSGCWTTCYTQRYLLVHPPTLKDLIQNLNKVRSLGAGQNQNHIIKPINRSQALRIDKPRVG